MTHEIFLEKMTWPEVRERLKESDIAIVVVGSIEPHGSHLTLDTDVVETWEITKRAAQKVADDVRPVVCPPIYYGVATEGLIKGTFQGVISLRSNTLKEVLKDICKSLVHHGFRKVVVMDGHWSNNPSVTSALQEVTEETGALMIAVRWWGSFGGDIIEKVIETPRYHACELETSMMLALGQRVQMDKAKRWIPKSPSKYMKFYFPAQLPYVEPAYGSICSWDKVAELGLVGDPTRASKEKGERIIQEVVDRLADFLRELKSLKV